jgi:hypothetical protein
MGVCNSRSADASIGRYGPRPRDGGGGAAVFGRCEHRPLHAKAEGRWWWGGFRTSRNDGVEYRPLEPRAGVPAPHWKKGEIATALRASR